MLDKIDGGELLPVPIKLRKHYAPGSFSNVSGESVISNMTAKE